MNDVLLYMASKTGKRNYAMEVYSFADWNAAC